MPIPDKVKRETATEAVENLYVCAERLGKRDSLLNLPLTIDTLKDLDILLGDKGEGRVKVFMGIIEHKVYQYYDGEPRPFERALSELTRLACDIHNSRISYFQRRKTPQ